MSYYIAAALVILLLGVGQILLKLGSKAGKSWLSSFLNPYTLSGYGLYLAITVINIYALQGIYLKYITSWLGLSYIWVVFLSRVVLNEQVSRQRMLGCFLIVLGVFVFSFPF